MIAVVAYSLVGIAHHNNYYIQVAQVVDDKIEAEAVEKKAVDNYDNHNVVVEEAEIVAKDVVVEVFEHVVGYFYFVVAVLVTAFAMVFQNSVIFVFHFPHFFLEKSRKNWGFYTSGALSH